MRTVAFSIFKGGTGKTTSTVNTAYALARKGKRVLLVDLDQQASATQYLNEDPYASPNLYEVFMGTKPAALAVRHTALGIDLLASNGLMAAIEEALETLLQQTPDLATGHTLVQRFRALLKEHNLLGLDGWLADARASGLRSFVSLAAGINADRAAVDGAITRIWSTGPVEGHNHRLKLIKRRGHGQASFSLLRRRVLAA